MELDAKQKDEVAKWFASGMGLDEMQKRIASEFGVKISYLDLRLMVAEMPQPQEKEESPEAVATPDDDAAEEAGPYEEDAPTPEGNTPPEGSDGQDGAVGGDVSVDMDAITIPGTIASGTATFSDGKSGKWYLDQMGRLGMADLPQGYRPSQEDAATFQTKLVELLRSKGLM